MLAILVKSGVSLLPCVGCGLGPGNQIVGVLDRTELVLLNSACTLELLLGRNYILDHDLLNCVGVHILIMKLIILCKN